MYSEGIEELGRFMLEHNPFSIKNDKGKVLKFDKYVDIYLYVLKEIRQYCKRGYIDYPVLVEHLTKASPELCMMMNEKAMKMYPVLRADCLIVDWFDLSMCEQLLKVIIKALHLITDSDFDSYHFDVAWEQFLDYNKTYTYEQINKIQS